MTRVYIQPSWINAAEDHTEWSGGNDQYRGDASIDISTFDKNGRARVEAFSDAAIEARKEKRKTSVPLKHRILPQSVRVDKLNAEILELEQAYRAGEFSPEDYTLFRDVAFKKRNRAQVLYEKAIAVKEPTQPDEDDSDLYTGLPEDEVVYYATNHASPQRESDIGCQWIDDLSSENSLKNILKKACVVCRTLVRLSHKAATYYKSLKEV